MAEGNNDALPGGLRYFLIAFGMASTVMPAVMLTRRSPVVANL